MTVSTVSMINANIDDNCSARMYTSDSEGPMQIGRANLLNEPSDSGIG